MSEHGLLSTRGEASLASVRALHERFDAWGARVWLDIEGPGWSIPVDQDYRVLRLALRAKLPDRPFTSDWALNGVFPGQLTRLRPALAWAVALVASAAVVAWVAYTFGLSLACAVVLLCLWPLGQLRACARVSRFGLRLGPVWSPLVPWDQIHAVGVRARPGRGVVCVFARHHAGVSEVRLPEALLPPFRARVARLGGLPFSEIPEAVVLRYERWRALALGLPTGVMVGALLAVWGASDRMAAALAGVLLCVAALGVSAAIRAVLTRWFAGGIVWMSLVWAAILWIGLIWTH